MEKRLLIGVLGAVVGLMGCAGKEDKRGTDEAALVSNSGLSSMNGLMTTDGGRA